MLPNVKGPDRTLLEMKIYSIMLILLSIAAPSILEVFEVEDWSYYVLSWTILGLSLWYASTVWRIDVSEEPDETGRIPSAASSFFVSMLYLALMFIVIVTGSFGQSGVIIGAIIATVFVTRTEWKSAT